MEYHLKIMGQLSFTVHRFLQKENMVVELELRILVKMISLYLEFLIILIQSTFFKKMKINVLLVFVTSIYKIWKKYQN